jgi:hypothetical protein
MRKLLFLLTGLTCLCASLLQAAKESDSTTQQLFEKLRSLSQTNDYWNRDYYDMHGNANQALQTLMIRRFTVTKEICDQIDSHSVKSHPVYLASLYDVLACVKDPASIPWLKRHLQGPRKGEIYEHWLPKWWNYMRGADSSQTRWMTQPEKWSQFFRGWAAQEGQSTNRLPVLRVLHGWFHDDPTEQLFAAIERNRNSPTEEVLLAQLYLWQHGKPVNSATLSRAIEKFPPSDEGKKLLLRYSSAFRHEAFVPALIDMADETFEENFKTQQQTLEAITFQRDISGSAGWKQWYAAHGKDGRISWAQTTGTELIKLASTNVVAAKALLSKFNLTWNDPVMFPYIEKLAGFPEMHSEIVGWINLTHGEVQFFSEELRSLASKIQASGDGHLEDWARNMLKTWDLFRPQSMTWEDEVRRSNMGV